MGKFFNTLHIKAANKDAFLTAFEWAMKKQGYVPCEVDDAEISYIAAFSEGWISLSNGDDSAEALAKLSQKFARDLKLASFVVEAVDSDFAILTLNTVSRKTSRLVVGDGEGYGVEKAPFSADEWKPLLRNGGEREFLAVTEQDGVFVEDSLRELGKIFGINPAVMAWCFEDFEENIGRGTDVISLSFKKRAEKKLTLNAAFKQVFGAALEPLGYQLIKGKYPYYARVVTDEIIHVITYYNDKRCYDRDHDYIFIKGGVATVYRPKIDLTQNPRRENWLTTNCSIYIYRLEHNLEKLDEELKRRLYGCPSLPEDNLKAMEYQLALTKRFILPELDKAVTIESCMEHNFEINMDLFLREDEIFGTAKGNDYYNEGILYFKTDRSVYDYRMRNAVSDIALREKSFFEKVHNHPELYTAVQAELERRKAANIEILRGYGVEL